MHESPDERTVGIHLTQMRYFSRCWLVLRVALLAAGLLIIPLNASAQDPKDPPAPQDQPDSADAQKPDLSDQIIHDVLEPFREGLESHTLRQALSVLDPIDMPDYAQARDQLTAFFRLYDPIRFRYKVLQASSDKDRAFVIGEIDVAATPVDRNQTPVQRNTQMRFQLKQEPNGWRVVGFTPADFFGQP